MCYLEFLKKYMRIVDFWLLCKMWKGRVVRPGLDFDRQVGIDTGSGRGGLDPESRADFS